MATLAELFRINETNLGLRRQFLRLTAADVAVLKELEPWAAETAAPLAKDFYDVQFAFEPTRTFFSAHASTTGRTLDQLRAGLEQAQAGYFHQIFQEAAGRGEFGVDYFEQRLRVGKLHNTINLPLKWYLGSYATYFDLVRTHLLQAFPDRDEFRADGERAIVVVMNADAQAIVDAFYFDTFQSMGVDLARVKVDSQQLDLSDRSDELKKLVQSQMLGIVKALDTLREASGQMTSSSDETSKAIAEIANAVSDVARGAERQVRMIDEANGAAEGASTAAAEAQTLSTGGLDAAEKATTAMASVRDSSAEVSDTMNGLATKSEQIGGMVETITGIASQTNLLALNAAIEAARAGEQGRGFAVVAEEVRKLAEESQSAAQQISDLNTEIQAETHKAVAVVEQSVGLTEDASAVVEQAREAFTAIGKSVSDINARLEQLATATTEVAAVAEQSSAAAQQVSASTEQTSASSDEVANSARALAGTAHDLEELVGSFNLEAVGA
ncbi:MAG TPA: globin-coupled sensor protein [Solirubrobacteraceae bacterium]|nr:globin-coupled sensor protein [Solirubrobacteraceae bacterium]